MVLVYASVQYILPKLRLQESAVLLVSLYLSHWTGLLSFLILGVFTQLALVLGIMLTQVAGIALATPSTWRFVFFISFILSVLQLLFSPMIVESPTWLFNQSRLEEHKHAVSRLWRDVPCKTT